MGLRVYIYGLGYRVQGIGFGVQGLGCTGGRGSAMPASPIRSSQSIRRPPCPARGCRGEGGYTGVFPRNRPLSTENTFCQVISQEFASSHCALRDWFPHEDTVPTKQGHTDVSGYRPVRRLYAPTLLEGGGEVHRARVEAGQGGARGFTRRRYEGVPRPNSILTGELWVL